MRLWAPLDRGPECSAAALWITIESRAPGLLRDGDRRRSGAVRALMRPRPFEQGYLAVLAKHSAGRRPVVSPSMAQRAPLQRPNVASPRRDGET